jgi:hypothetical protein
MLPYGKMAVLGRDLHPSLEERDQVGEVDVVCVPVDELDAERLERLPAHQVLELPLDHLPFPVEPSLVGERMPWSAIWSSMIQRKQSPSGDTTIRRGITTARNGSVMYTVSPLPSRSQNGRKGRRPVCARSLLLRHHAAIVPRAGASGQEGGPKRTRPPQRLGPDGYPPAAAAESVPGDASCAVPGTSRRANSRLRWAAGIQKAPAYSAAQAVAVQIVSQGSNE